MVIKVLIHDMNSIQFNSIQFNSIQFNSIQFNSIQFNSFILKLNYVYSLNIYSYSGEIYAN